MNKSMFIKTCYIAIMPFLLVGCASQGLTPPAPNSMASKIIFLNELPTMNIYDLRMATVNNFLVVEADIIHNDDVDSILKVAPWFTTLPVLVVGSAVQPLFSTKAPNNSIQYRFQWQDRNGMRVGSEENWKVLNFSPSQAQHIKGIATSQYAVDFKLELKSNY